MNFFSSLNIDFIGKRYIFFAISLTLMVAGIISLCTKGLNLGLDFTGGTLVQVQFEKPAAIDEVRTALEKGGKRATLEAGGLRITVSVDELDLAVGGDTDMPNATPNGAMRSSVTARTAGSASASRLQLDRARTVASSLDLRGATVAEALEVLDRYLDDVSLAGLDQVTVIHGMGTGALRDAVREHAGSHPLVREWRPGGRGEGGDGATIVAL